MRPHAPLSVPQVCCRCATAALLLECRSSDTARAPLLGRRSSGACVRAPLLGRRCSGAAARALLLGHRSSGTAPQAPLLTCLAPLPRRRYSRCWVVAPAPLLGRNATAALPALSTNQKNPKCTAHRPILAAVIRHSTNTHRKCPHSTAARLVNGAIQQPRTSWMSPFSAFVPDIQRFTPHLRDTKPVNDRPFT